MLPTLKGIKAEGLDYVGFLYFGLMMTEKGPYVIEYNARFGDPEAQAILPRLMTDILEICKSCNHKSIDKVDIRWDNKESACICLVSEGYPSKYKTGFTIQGLDRLQHEHDEALVFFAGVRAGDSGLETDGGRVLGITCLDGGGLAARKAYEAASVLSFAGMRYRTDIGLV
jgi:phosphoribosylamine--glycine ligase